MTATETMPTPVVRWMKLTASHDGYLMLAGKLLFYRNGNDMDLIPATDPNRDHLFVALYGEYECNSDVPYGCRAFELPDGSLFDLDVEE